MTELDALWAACEAAPEDGLPRLVLADWLEEHDGEVGCHACGGVGRHHYVMWREFGGECRSSNECGLCSGTGRVPNGYAALAAGLRGTVGKWPRAHEKSHRDTRDRRNRNVWTWVIGDRVTACPEEIVSEVWDRLSGECFASIYKDYPTWRAAVWDRLSGECFASIYKDYPTWRAAVEDLCRAWAGANMRAGV